MIVQFKLQDFRAISGGPQLACPIAKMDVERQLVFGKLSVIELADGTVVKDLQGHIIPPEELENGVYEYVLEFREAGDRHNVIKGIGRLVESVVLTKEKQSAMGIPPNTVDVCWWVGFKVDNQDTWDKIKSGEYAMLSIGGEAVLEDAPAT